MKIVLLGANGTLGKAIAAELTRRHSIVSVGRTSGDLRADMRDLESLRALFLKTGQVDGVVCAAGSVHFGPWGELTPEKFDVGLRDKLMGQVNLVLAGQGALVDGGSFTLTSGILSDDPIRSGACASLVNGALESFARGGVFVRLRARAIKRVTQKFLLEPGPVYGWFFPGYKPVPAADVALAYSKSVEGRQTGKIYKVW